MSAGKAQHLEGPFKRTLWRSIIIYKVHICLSIEFDETLVHLQDSAGITTIYI